MKKLALLLMTLAGYVGADPLVHTWQEVAPGVHVGIRDDSPRSPVMGSTTFVVGETGVVVFDGGGLPLMAERAIERIRSVTDKPVTHVIISHWHQDHNWGLQAFLDAFPGTAIIAHPNTRDTLALRAPGDEAGARTQMERLRETARGLLARDDTAPDRRKRLEVLLADGELLEREYQRVTTVTPTQVVDNRLVLDGGRIEVLHLGRGNTDGDLVLWLPRERIVASGDLVVRPTPYGFGSYPAEWADTLRRLIALDYRLLVPGHGDLQRDTVYVDLLIETLESVAKQMAALVADGKDEETAVAALDFSAVEPRFTGGDPYLATLFRIWFKQPIGVAAFRVASGASPELPVNTPPPLEYLQRAEQVAPRVHVLRQGAPVFAGVIGNVSVIEQDDGLVLVDSGASHGSGLRVVEMVRAISPKPVKAVVITHWHNDHPLGLSAIVEAWPDTDIIAHPLAAADMQSGRLVGVPRAPSAEYDAERRRILTDAYTQLHDTDAANSNSPEERAGWERLMSSLAPRLDELPGTHLVLPRRTAERLTLPDETAPVEIMFLGRANTSGDLSIWLPRQRVLIAGDAVVEPVPYMFNVYPSEMVGAFDRMRDLEFTVLVPGHGAPQYDTDYLDKLTALVADVQRQVAPLALAGVPLAEVAGRTDFTAQRKLFAGEDRWLVYWFDRYALTPLIDSVYREAQGNPLGPPPLARP